MNVEQLSKSISHPDTLRKLIGDYTGGYSVGVTASPPAYLLKVESEDVSKFPKNIDVEGHTVPVVVQGKFKVPSPLQAQ